MLLYRTIPTQTFTTRMIGCRRCLSSESSCRAQLLFPTVIWFANTFEILAVRAKPNSEGQISFFGGISLHSSPQDNSEWRKSDMSVKLGGHGSSRENAQHCREPGPQSKNSISLFVLTYEKFLATLANSDFPFY